MNVIDLYALVAHNRGLQAHELPVAERERLAARALPLIRDGFEFIAGSGRAQRDPIEIVSYDETWPERFEALRTRLAEVLGSIAGRIEHVGSTAVPGLPAKPLIDVQVSVDDLQGESRYVPPIESLGVQLRSRDVEHRFFRPFPGLPREVHIHVCALAGEWEKRHLLFRDYLRADATAREAYATSKKLAAKRWSDDRVAYTEAKDDQIRELMVAADSWARRTGWSASAAEL
ncbi:MAG: GrpB family protein [Candidatus Dormibacteraceae bacterium]